MRFRCGVLAVLFCFFLAACVDRPADKPVQVGFLLATMGKERYQKDRMYFTERVRDLGGTVRFDSAGNEVRFSSGTF